MDFPGLVCSHLCGILKIDLEKVPELPLPSDIVDSLADVGTRVTFYGLRLDVRSCGFSLAFYNAHQAVLLHSAYIPAAACRRLSSGL